MLNATVLLQTGFFYILQYKIQPDEQSSFSTLLYKLTLGEGLTDAISGTSKGIITISALP